MTSTSDATTYATHGVFLLPDGRELTGKELGKLPKTEFDEALDQIPEDLRKRYQKARSRHIPKNEVSTKATQKASNAKRGGTAATTTSSAARANITTTAVTSAAAAEEAEEAETAAAEEAEAAAAPGPARKKRPRVPLAMFEPGYVSDAPPLNRLSGHTFPQGPPTFFGPQQQQAPLLLSAVLAQSPAGSVSSGMASVHPSPAVMDVLQAFAAAHSHGGSLFGAASRHSSRHSSPAPSLALQGALPASHGEAQHATWPAEAPHDEAHHGTSPGGADGGADGGGGGGDDGGADGIFGAPLAMFLGSYAATKELGDSLRSEMQSLVGSVRSAASDGGRSGAEVGTQAALADSGVGEAMGAHTAQLNAIGAQLGTQGAQITAIGGQLDAQGSQLNAIGGQISTLQTTTEARRPPLSSNARPPSPSCRRSESDPNLRLPTSPTLPLVHTERLHHHDLFPRRGGQCAGEHGGAGRGGGGAPGQHRGAPGQHHDGAAAADAEDGRGEAGPAGPAGRPLAAGDVRHARLGVHLDRGGLARVRAGGRAVGAPLHPGGAAGAALAGPPGALAQCAALGAECGAEAARCAMRAPRERHTAPQECACARRRGSQAFTYSPRAAVRRPWRHLGRGGGAWVGDGVWRWHARWAGMEPGAGHGADTLSVARAAASGADERVVRRVELSRGASRGASREARRGARRGEAAIAARVRPRVRRLAVRSTRVADCGGGGGTECDEGRGAGGRRAEAGGRERRAGMELLPQRANRERRQSE